MAGARCPGSKVLQLFIDKIEIYGLGDFAKKVVWRHKFSNADQLDLRLLGAFALYHRKIKTKSRQIGQDFVKGLKAGIPALLFMRRTGKILIYIIRNEY